MVLLAVAMGAGATATLAGHSDTQPPSRYPAWHAAMAYTPYGGDPGKQEAAATREGQSLPASGLRERKVHPLA